MAGVPFTIYKREAFRVDAGTYKISMDSLKDKNEFEFEFGGVVLRRVKENEEENEGGTVFELPEFYLIKEKEWSGCESESFDTYESVGPRNMLLHLMLPSNSRLEEYTSNDQEKLRWNDFNSEDEDGEWLHRSESEFDAKRAERIPKRYCISDHEIVNVYDDSVFTDEAVARTTMDDLRDAFGDLASNKA